FGFRSRLLLTLIVFLFCVPTRVAALGPSRLINCLKAAAKVESAAFKAKHKYVYEEPQLREGLKSSCAELSYEVFQTTAGGFRIVARLSGETWSIDNLDNITRMNAGDGASAVTAPKLMKTEAKTPAPAPVAPGAKATPPSGNYPKPLVEK